MKTLTLKGLLNSTGCLVALASWTLALPLSAAAYVALHWSLLGSVAFVLAPIWLMVSVVCVQAALGITRVAQRQHAVSRGSYSAIPGTTGGHDSEIGRTRLPLIVTEALVLAFLVCALYAVEILFHAPHEIGDLVLLQGGISLAAAALITVIIYLLAVQTSGLQQDH